jgi:uncharacterized membrane protein
MLIALFYSVKPFFAGFDALWADYNNLLTFAGLGISFSTLQDTSKTQNKISKKVWENPTYGNRVIIVMSVYTFLFVLLGIVGLYASNDSIIKEMSFGIMVFGIGCIGLLKAAIEMFENHRKDKNT